MPAFFERSRDLTRFAIITLVIAGLYVLLTEVEMRIMPFVASGLERLHVSGHRQEPSDVQARSAAIESRLPAEWRRAVFDLGYQIGYVAEAEGSRLAAGASFRPDQLVAMRISQAARLAGLMGVLPADWPSARNLKELAELSARIEADETGLAGRVERQLTERHRHLFLTGAHAGLAHRVLVSSEASVFNLSPDFARHARLAGLPAEKWKPLTQTPEGAGVEEKIAAFEGALDTLARAAAEPVSVP